MPSAIKFCAKHEVLRTHYKSATTSRYLCTECRREKYWRTRDSVLAKQRAARTAKLDKYRARERAYRKANPDKAREKLYRWRRNHPNIYKAIRRRYMSKPDVREHRYWYNKSFELRLRLASKYGTLGI